MYLFKTLENTDKKIIYKSFMEAFSDYSVNLFLPYEDFEKMLEGKGFNPNISIGLFYKENLVGFILNSKRQWLGKDTAYDMGTALLPDYRNCGFSKKMVIKMIDILKEKGINQYLLEVIQNNTRAFELYKSQNFQISRDFSVFQLKDNLNIPCKSSQYTIETISNIDDDLWEEVKSFWEILPSWQNSIDSVKAVKEIFSYVVAKDREKIIGYGIIEKKSGKIPQLAVKKDYRNQGVGRNILCELIKNTDSKLIKFINIDRKYKDMERFLETLGFTISSLQYEMILDLK